MDKNFNKTFSKGVIKVVNFSQMRIMQVMDYPIIVLKFGLVFKPKGMILILSQITLIKSTSTSGSQLSTSI